MDDIQRQPADHPDKRRTATPAAPTGSDADMASNQRPVPDRDAADARRSVLHNDPLPGGNLQRSPGCLLQGLSAATKDDPIGGHPDQQTIPSQDARRNGQRGQLRGGSGEDHRVTGRSAQRTGGKCLPRLSLHPVGRQEEGEKT